MSAGESQERRTIRTPAGEVVQQRCVCCGLWLALSSFERTGEGLYLKSRCRECTNRLYRERVRNSDDDSRRGRKFRRLYEEKKKNGARICKKEGCDTKLSAYNPEPFCSVHQREEEERRLLAELDFLSRTQGQALRERRRALSLTRRELAARAGLTLSTVANAEREDAAHAPTKETRERLDSALRELEEVSLHAEA